MEGLSTMWTSKWKWGAGAGIAVAAALIAYLWWMQRERGGPGVPTGGKGDAHAQLCAKRHPPFSRLKLSRADDNPPPKRGRQPAAAATAAGTAPQPLIAAAGAVGGGEDVVAFAGGGDDCPINVCGMNGTWLGSGVPFRTLHVSPYRHNEANLSILRFLGPARDHGQREPLTLHVDGDRLHPTGQDVVEPGSVLLLGPADTPGGAPGRPTYELTITGVDDSHKFLVDCAGCTRPTYHVYQFSARSLDDDCPLQVCAPGLDDGSDATHNLIGNAVIFQGDFYEPGYTVRTAAATGYDDDTFNIACMGTAISKLHVLRHTAASQGAPSDPMPPPVDKRQAILRMLTADYCGAGHPFTHDGVPLHFGIDLAAGYDGLLNPGPNPPVPDPNTGISVPASSRFRLDPAGGIASVDALWTADGATCIGTPRQLIADPRIWTKIEAVCRSVNHPVKHCEDVAPAPSTQPDAHLPPGSYAISQNP
jgi:ADYC domain